MAYKVVYRNNVVRMKNGVGTSNKWVSYDRRTYKTKEAANKALSKYRSSKPYQRGKSSLKREGFNSSLKITKTTSAKPRRRGLFGGFKGFGF